MAIQHPLYDIDLERALIGCFLADTKCVAIAKSLCQPDDFHEEMHKLIVSLIYEFDEEGRSIDPVTLNSWIKHNPRAEELDELAGEALPPDRRAGIYLASLADGAPALPHLSVSGFALTIADFAQRRAIVWAMGEATDAITAREKSVPGAILPALEPVVRLVDDIADKQMAGEHEETDAGEITWSMLRGIQEQAIQAEVKRSVRTLIPPLDLIIDGLFPSNLVIIAGRPGMGKSILATNLLRTTALQGVPADYWSIEMPAREVAARLITDAEYDFAIEHRLPPLEYSDFVKFKATAAQMERAAQAYTLLPPGISVFARDRVTMQQIAATTRARVSRQPGYRVVIVDHLHIVTPGERYGGRRVDEVSEITKAAKQLAKRIDGTVVLLSQLSRGIEDREDKRPSMSDMRDSGSIEQDADVVLGLFRPEYYAHKAITAAKTLEQTNKAKIELEGAKNKLEIGVLKQRSGATRMATCWIEPYSSAIRGENPFAAPSQKDPTLGLIPDYTP